MKKVKSTKRLTAAANAWERKYPKGEFYGMGDKGELRRSGDQARLPVIKDDVEKSNSIKARFIGSIEFEVWAWEATAPKGGYPQQTFYKYNLRFKLENDKWIYLDGTRSKILDWPQRPPKYDATQSVQNLDLEPYLAPLFAN